MTLLMLFVYGLALTIGTDAFLQPADKYCADMLHELVPTCSFDILSNRLSDIESRHQRLASIVKNVTDVGENIDSLSVRISGDNENSGIAEVYRNGHWGTICGDQWTSLEANTFCKMIGFHSGSSLPVAPTTKPYLLSDVRCSASDTSIFDCGYKALSGAGPLHCRTNQAATVQCHIGIRLVGSNTLKGTVEISHLGQWGPICDSSWEENGRGNADVVCRMLGHQSGGRALGGSVFGAGNYSTALLSNVKCLGNEQSILDCPRSDFSPPVHCPSSNHAGVICF